MIATNSFTRPTLRIVVLAAGFSTRLGRPKALARVRGTSLLRSTVRVVGGIAASRIIVVIPPRAIRTRTELRGHRVTFVENCKRAKGLSTSVRRGLIAARRSAAVLLLPVDLPHLKRLDLERMIARWNGARRRVIARSLATGTHGARPKDHPEGGSPLILPHWLYARALGISGDRGLRELVGELSSGDVVLLNLPSAGLDVDTPQELERARRRIQRFRS